MRYVRLQVRLLQNFIVALLHYDLVSVFVGAVRRKLVSELYELNERVCPPIHGSRHFLADFFC
jgi:hypothetical protein